MKNIGSQTERRKKNDAHFGEIVPSLVELLIVGVAMVSTPSVIGLKYPLLEAIVVVRVPDAGRAHVESVCRWRIRFLVAGKSLCTLL